MPTSRQAGLALATALCLWTGGAQALTYAECTALVERSPGDGYKAATAWAKTTDDPGAQHCAALAEVALQRYGDAADRLNRLIDQTANPYEAAALLGQLGNVRMLDGKADLAVDAFTRALKNTPNDPQMLADRARAFAALGQWARAARDLDGAVQIDDEDPELYLLYATALREAGKIADARGAVEKALRLAPNAPEVLLERGRIRLIDGDRKGAAGDWKTVADSAPKGPVRDAALASLKALEKTKGK